MTASARDGEGLLAAVLAEPSEDLHRIVYADWCEDSGDAARAEFIRAQVQLAVIDAIPHGCGKGGEGETTCPACGAASDRYALAAAEDELFRFHATRWLGECVPGGWGGELLDGFGTWRNRGTRVLAKRTGERFFEFRRGFIWAVRLPLDGYSSWRKHGKGLLASCPLERVEASGKRPATGLMGLWPIDERDADESGGPRWGWARESEVGASIAFGLPDDVFALLPPSPLQASWGWAAHEERAAEDAVSQALLALRKPAPR